jgi:LPS-assembly protein
MKKYLIFIFMLLSSFSIYAEGNNLSCIPNSIVCENCPESKILFPLQELDDYQEGLDIEADNSEVLETDSYKFTGNVKLKTSSHFLSADQIEYSQGSELTTATGNVKFQDESFIMASDQLTAQMVDDELIAKTTNANYQDISSGVLSPNGFAQEITKDKSKINLKNTSYTLCPLGQQDWMIKAKQIKLNQETNRGVADNATLYFYGMPIFYLPKYGWVLSGRGSGFLSPSFNSYSEPDTINKDGKFTSYGRSNRFRVPYYFNLAPDRDLILALTYMSSRGIIYEGKYRQLVKSKVSDEREHSILSVESKYLVEDKITGLPRWLLYSSLDQDLTEKLTLNIAYNRISDRNYFKDIDRATPLDLTLKSNLKLSYNDPKKKFSASILTEHEQTVSSVPNYQRAIDTSASKIFRSDKESPITLDLTTTKFTHKKSEKASGIRSTGTIGITRTFATEFPVITTKANYDIANYQLKDANDITRKSAGTGISFSFPFNFISNLQGSDVKNNITPSLSYNYKQKVVQGSIPVFDTTDKYEDIITFADLTSGERYTGRDRVSNANDVTLAISTSSSVGNKLSITSGTAQTFYSDDEVVSNTGRTNYETRKSYSDIATGVGLTIGKKFTFTNNIQFNPDINKVVKKENSLSFKLTPKKFITIALSDEGEKETAQVYGSYPISESFHFFGGLNRITSKGITSQETTGIAYESCCWAARVAHFKDGNGANNNYNYSTGFEIIFTGLGSTATPLKGRIERNIPFYNSSLR